MSAPGAGTERPSRALTFLLAALAALGLVVAGYLAVLHARGASPVCFASGGCETVQNSRYSQLAGIPVPFLGLAGYAMLLASTFMRGEFGRLSGLLVAATGVVFSAYFTYLEVFVIGAVCQWCVASALIMTSAAIVAAVRFTRIR